MTWKRIPRFSLRTLLAVTALCATFLYLIILGWSSYRRHAEDVSVMKMDERIKDRGERGSEVVRNGQVVLVQKGKALGAFVTEGYGVHNGKDVLQYRWYYRADGQGRFDAADANVFSGTSIATRGAPTRDRRIGDIFITFGPFEIKWGRVNKKHWGWVSYNRESTMRLCITDESRLDRLNALDPAWRYKLTGYDRGAAAADLVSLNWQKVTQSDSPFVVTLEHVKGSDDDHVFRVAFHASTDRFLLPYPHVTGLKLSTLDGRYIGTWRTDLFVTQPPGDQNDEFVLNPKSRIAFDLRAYFNCEPSPERPWTLKLPAGRLRARFIFDLDLDLERYDFLVKRSSLSPITIPWGGTVESNPVEFELFEGDVR
jgi:hypothetical protein